MRVTKLRFMTPDEKLQKRDIRPGETVYVTPNWDEKTVDVVILSDYEPDTDENWSSVSEVILSVTKQ